MGLFLHCSSPHWFNLDLGWINRIIQAKQSKIIYNHIIVSETAREHLVSVLRAARHLLNDSHLYQRYANSAQTHENFS